MGPLPMIAPPAPIRVLLTWEPASPRDLGRIREGLVRHFAGHADLRERLELVATELTGNALRHGSPPVTVRLLQADDCYVVDVTDCAADRPPEPAGARRDTGAGGRGLHIVRSLSAQVGWYATGDTKHVWASLSR
jgi:anti-sigma regulatory factor (Ser/Thr protein kinase)